MPKSHREYAQWTPERIIRWASKAGKATAAVAETIISQRAHPQQGYRACLGIMRLGKSYGNDRLEAACRRAQAFDAYSYRHIESILKHDLDRRPLPQTEVAGKRIEHENIRGSFYYDAAVDHAERQKEEIHAHAPNA